MDELLALAGISFAVFVLAALAQAVSGFGSALVAVPLLTLVVDPATALVSATVVSLLLVAGSSWRERDHVEAKVARRLTLAGLLGMPLGLVALRTLDDRSLSTLIALTLLTMVALLALGVRLPSGPRTQLGAGVTSGALLTSTGMNGPPLVLVLHAFEPRRFRATLQAVFLGQDVVAVVAFAVLGLLSTQTLACVVGGALGLPLGWLVGDRIFHLLAPERFRAVVLAGLVLTGLSALANAVLR